ncbi:HAMP domain-containing protein [Roseiconus nitratireducens]|uniref:histidine kinase n=1 Tax=Roseiconus nitratireducens TaxID=2605748 RepID=A0A5M6D4W9_9BACT|nr:ATP-binding protein [Roseiconus nitratireducens]KAA5542558.1 HAMP domain-containing protein [Roseiconus nitratireducens]
MPSQRPPSSWDGGNQGPGDHSADHDNHHPQGPWDVAGESSGASVDEWTDDNATAFPSTDLNGLPHSPTGIDAPSTVPAENDAADGGLGQKTDHARSLRSKLVLALAGIFAVVVGVDEFVRQQVISPEFAKLERIAAMKETHRVRSALNAELDFLAGAAALDLHQWETTTDSNAVNPSSQSARPGPPASSTAGRMDIRPLWSAHVGTDGRWSWLPNTPEVTAPAPQSDESESPRAVDGLQFPSLSASLFATAAEHQTSELGPTPDALSANPLRGLTRGSDQQLYLYCALPLELETSPKADAQRAAGSLPPATEFFVAVRRLDQQVIQELEHRTSVEFTIDPLDASAGSLEGICVDAESETRLRVQSPLRNAAGEPLARLSIVLPRDMMLSSERAKAFARYLSLCGACASLLILLLLLQRIVIGRVETIREAAESIGQAGVIDPRATSGALRVTGQDEIGQLAQAFERMRRRLGETQRRLSDASHAAGMSLVANTVIHNVGNVLTNVNSLVETVTEQVDQLRIEPLNRLAERLRRNADDADLQMATPDYLRRLSETLEDDKDELARLLHTLSENVQHIHEVIREQRRHARRSVDVSDVAAIDVIEEGVSYCQAKLDRDEIRVELAVPTDLRFQTDRSLLVQVFINIIGNAQHALAEVKGRQPTLVIQAERLGDSIEFRFRDNGCGMDSRTLSMAFDAHFTTHQKGSGLGLHFCAIAVKQLGGCIRACSEGPGKGAVFSVELPLSTSHVALPEGDLSGRVASDSSKEKIHA